MVTYVVEVTMFNSKAKCDLPGSFITDTGEHLLDIPAASEYCFC